MLWTWVELFWARLAAAILDEHKITINMSPYARPMMISGSASRHALINKARVRVTSTTTASGPSMVNLSHSCFTNCPCFGELLCTYCPCSFLLTSLQNDVCASPANPSVACLRQLTPLSTSEWQEDGGLQGLQHPGTWNLCNSLRSSSDPPSCKGSAMQLPAL